MVLAYHLVWTANGWWLPNDPRGSGSATIRVAKLAELGDIHFGRKAVQPASSELRAHFQQASALLKYPPRTFTDEEVQIIAESFGQVVRDNKYACHACAIMPEHVHLLMGRRLADAETMVELFKQESRTALIDAGRFPPTHAVWTVGQRIIYKSSSSAVVQCIKYVENNPDEIGRRRQVWDFVTGYDPSFRPF